MYTGISGTAVWDLTNSAKYLAGTPDSTNWVTDLFEAPIDVGDDYGQRLHGYILPPQSGYYTFWMASDDNGELWLSTNACPLTNLARIAYLYDWAWSREWGKNATQQSSPIYLEAGKMYYIRALMKESGGGDNLAVRWQLPDGNMEEPIPCTRLLPPGGPFAPPQIADQPDDVTATEGETATFSVTVSNMYPVAYQWQRGGSNVAGATASNYVLAAVTLADTNAQFRCILTNTLGAVTSATATLTVLADTNPPTLSAVYNAGSVTVWVVFSEPVGSNSATASGNYRLSGPAVGGAALAPDLRRVALTVAPLTNGTSYTLTVSNVLDRSAASNRIADGTSWTFTAREFVSQEIGYPAVTGGTSYAGDGIELAAAGAGLGGEADQFRFTWKQQTGDFDVRVRVESLDNTHAWAQAGIMARALLEGDSDFCATLASPSIAGVRFAFRRTGGGNVLLNPDFDLGRQAGQLWPTNWGAWGSAVAETNGTTHAGGKAAPAAAHSGQWMLHASNNRTTTDNNWAGEGQWFSVTPGESYVFSAYVLIQSNLPASQNAYLDIEWYDSGKSWPDISPRYYSIYLSGQCGWTRVAVTGTAPGGAVWGKAVIAYEDIDGRTNSIGEQYNAYWDSASLAQGSGGSVESRGFFPVNYPHTWLRLKRVGNVFTGFASYDGASWAPLGSVTNALPGTLYLGMVATGHDEDETATAGFRDWGAASGGTTGSAANVGSEPIGPSSRSSGLIVSEIMYHPPGRADGKDLEYVEVFNTEPVDRDLTGYALSGDADYDFPAGTIIPAGGFLVVARVPSDVQSVYGLSDVLGPYDGSLPNGDGTVRLRNARGAVIWEAEYADDDPWPVAPDGTGHSLVLARPSFGEGDVRAWAASARYGGSPGAMEAVWSNAWAGIVINEFIAHTDEPEFDFIELYNHGTQAVSLAGCVLSDDLDENRCTIPGGTVLGPRKFLLFDTNALGFNLSSKGETIVLRDPSSNVIDIVRFGAQQNGVSSGRYPDGSAGFHELADITGGTNNAALRIRPIVIHEIMYHPLSEEDDDEYVELYNNSSSNLNLRHYRFVDGIDFVFTNDAVIPAYGYLVVAKNAARLMSNYPALGATNTFGNYSGSLKNSGERVALAKPDDMDLPDQDFVVVDDVTYSDGWGRWSDGGGSSLELLDARSDNRRAANWADSDETAKAAWTTMAVTSRMDNGNGSCAIDELHILVKGDGECLVDEIFVGNTSLNRVTNKTFNAGAGLGGWVVQGDHVRTSWDANGSGGSNGCMHVRSSGGGDTGPNRLETDLLTAMAPGADVTIRASVRWLCGHPDVLFRLHGNWAEALCSMAVPADLGSPGAANSRATNNAPPAISDVVHAPILPAAGEPAIVTARVHDPDHVGEVWLRYRVDPATATNSVRMLDDGTGGDAVARDGQYSATVTGQASGTLVAFWIQASDSNAAPATARFPAEPGYEALIRFGETRPWGAIGSYRVWMTQANMATWTNRPHLSNEPVDGTFVGGDFRVVYGAAARYRGSPFLRIGYDGPMGGLCAYIVQFPKGDRFLGETKINLDTLEPGRDNTLQRERTMFWMAEQIGLPITYQRYVHLYFNGLERGEAYSDSRQVDSDYVQCWFPDHNDGEIFKVDDWVEYASDSSWAVAWPDGTTNATLERCTTTGGELKKARYRWNWEKKSNGGLTDDYGRLLELVETMNETNDARYVQRVQALVDADEWMDTFALRHVTTDWDGYGYARGKNMYAYKAPGLRWHMLLWDLDFGLGADYQSTSLNLFENIHDPVLSNRFFQVAPFRRAYWQAVKRLVDGPMLYSRVEPFMEGWYSALSDHGVSVYGPDSVLQWIAQRRNYCQAQCQAVEAPFDVFGAGGSTNRNLVVLTGTAPLDVTAIRVNGVLYAPSWTSVSNWSITVALTPGDNALTLEGIDREGNPVGGATDSISFNYTGSGASPAGSLVINEIMYHPTNEGAEYLEIHNLSTNYAFDLYDYRVEGLGFTLTNSAVVGPGAYVVVAENAAVFAATYGATIDVAAAYAPSSLNNAGEVLRLWQLNGTNADVFVDEVIYAEAAPWPTNADGGGSSLQLVDALEDNNRVGNWAATTNGAAWTPGSSNSVCADLPPFPLLWLNEVQSTNATGPFDNTGTNREPWVELFNDDAVTFNLTNYYLTDTYTNLFRWSFRTNAVVGTGVFYLVWCDAQAQTVFMTNHTNFRLDTNGGSVALVHSNAGRAIVVDYVDYPAIAADRSYGDFPDGVWTNRRLFLYASPRATNNGAGSPVPVTINEWLADNVAANPDPADGNYEDWIELYNEGTNDVDLSGYTMTDNLGSPAKWTISNGVTIKARSFLLVWADEEPSQNLGGTNDLHADFKLGKGGEAIGLYTPAGLVVDTVVFGAQATDVTEGRWPDGDAARYTLAFPTPRAPNVVSTNNAAPALDPVGDKDVDEGSLLAFTATASDADTPAQTLTFSLDAGAPDGASIDPDTGWFSWTPEEEDGPGLYYATVRVTDNGWSNRSDSETIEIEVEEENEEPEIEDLDDVRLNPGSLLQLTFCVEDDDVPANALWYSLEPGFPAGAGISSNGGVFSWEPADGQASTTNVVTVRVTDNGVPPLSGTGTFTIVVSGMDDLFEAEVLRQSVDEEEGFTVRWSSWSGSTYRVQFGPWLSDPPWSNLPGDVTATGEVATKVDTSMGGIPQRFYRILRLVP